MGVLGRHESLKRGAGAGGNQSTRRPFHLSPAKGPLRLIVSAMALPRAEIAERKNWVHRPAAGLRRPQGEPSSPVRCPPWRHNLAKHGRNRVVSPSPPCSHAAGDARAAS